MSELKEFGEAMNCNDRTSRKGLGGGAYLDGLIVLIVAITTLFSKVTYGGMSAGTTSAILFGIAALLLFTGYFLVKNMKVGDILALVSGVFTLVWGILTEFTSLKGDMFFGIYFLLTGALMLISFVMIILKDKGIGQ